VTHESTLHIACPIFQALIRGMYFEKRFARGGVDGTFMWLMEEVGEAFAAATSRRDAPKRAGRLEFADVLGLADDDRECRRKSI